MINLQSLLEKFTRSLGKDTLAREAVISCIKKFTRIELQNENVSLKEGVLTLSLSPVKKNEVKLKEKRIIENLQQECGIKVSRILYL